MGLLRSVTMASCRPEFSIPCHISLVTGDRAGRSSWPVTTWHRKVNGEGSAFTLCTGHLDGAPMRHDNASCRRKPQTTVGELHAEEGIVDFGCDLSSIPPPVSLTEFSSMDIAPGNTCASPASTISFAGNPARSPGGLFVDEQHTCIRILVSWDR